MGIGIEDFGSVSVLGIGHQFGQEFEQDSSRNCSAWKDFRFKPLSFLFPPDG